MSETSYQPQTWMTSQTEPANPIRTAADEFRRNVQEASERLSNADSQLVAMGEELAGAIAEAKQAAEAAKEAQRKAEETQQQMQRDYGAVADLVRDLQLRISALATLAQPLPFETRVEPAAAANPLAEFAPAQTNEAENESQGSEGQQEQWPASEQPWSARSW